MKFRAHDTFFIRKGWLYKGLKNVSDDPQVFMGTNGNPMDVLGIGANMVKSLRYWLQAVKLTEEPPVGRKAQNITELGRVIYDNDRYMEEMGTLWLLHYQLATNYDNATTWYFFFNEFKLSEFTKNDFVTHLNKLISNNEESVSERSLEDDFNCLINTYVPRIKSNPQKIQPENNIDCPLGELGLVDIVNKKEKVYKKSVPKKDTLHPLILLAVMVDQAKESKEMKISSLQNDFKNVGKVFNLDIITLTNLLYKVELMGYVKVIRTAGLDVVRIETEMNFIECVREYYRLLNN